MTLALKVENLCKSFGGIAVTQNFSLAMDPGERRLIIGPNGAGKTTLFAQITGEIQPDSGSIHVRGQDVTREPGYTRAHMGVSRTYQIITLLSNETLVHNIVLGLIGISPRRHQLFTPLTEADDFYARALELLEGVGLKHRAQRKVSEISYGEQRRVEIALAMAQSPTLLLLDEPLAGLSQDERVIVSKLIKTISRKTAILMIEHDMEMALAFAEKISVMQYGKLIVEGYTDAVVTDPRTQELYLGH